MRHTAGSRSQPAGSALPRGERSSAALGCPCRLANRRDPDPGRTVAVARLAVDDAGIARSPAGLTHKADASVGPNQALMFFRAHIVPNDVGQIARGTELCDEDVLDLRSSIALAQQEALVKSVE